MRDLIDARAGRPVAEPAHAGRLSETLTMCHSDHGEVLGDHRI
jgi:hypothetical protein